MARSRKGSTIKRKHWKGYCHAWGVCFKKGNKMAFFVSNNPIYLSDPQRQSFYNRLQRDGIKKIQFRNGYITSVKNALGIDNKGKVIPEKLVA